MNVPRSMLKELVDRKLWPIALVLIIALVAVPVLLTKKAPTNIVTPPTGPLPYSSGTTLPAISVKTAQGNSNLGGKGRNPFTPQHVATTATTATVAAVITPPAGTTTTSTGTSGTSPSSGGTPTPTPTTPAPAPAPKPAPTGLTSTQAYHVSLAITTANGGVNTIDPLERLSILPSKNQPMLVELGVLQGGHSVVFVVEPGTVVSGAGSCTPGPIDCEILTLNAGQREGISKQSASGSTPVALFSVNSISADKFASAAAANKARETASDVGRQLLSRSALSAISLFQYDPSVGAVVDLRNLTVGG
jgi:hypothetical protein